MKSARRDYSKKATGHHKIRGPKKNRKAGTSTKSISASTMKPVAAGGSNRADKDLGKLRGY